MHLDIAVSTPVRATEIEYEILERLYQLACIIWNISKYRVQIHRDGGIIIRGVEILMYKVAYEEVSHNFPQYCYVNMY